MSKHADNVSRLAHLDVLVGVEIPSWQGDGNVWDLGHGQHAARPSRLRGAHLLWMESVIATKPFSPLASFWMMFGGRVASLADWQEEVVYSWLPFCGFISIRR